MSPRLKTALALAAVTLLALAARFHRLDHLGFYGDEDTTALPARSLAEGGRPAFPTGMEYRRALPLTHLHAQAARLFGPENEFPYRFWPALLGALCAPALFLAVRRDLGFGAALVAGLLIALSEWHVSHSREARMYAVLTLFVILTGAWTWRWGRSGRWRDLALAAVFFLVAISIHRLGLFSATFFLFLIALPGGRAHPAVCLAAAIALLGISTVWAQWVEQPYLDYALDTGKVTLDRDGPDPGLHGALGMALLAAGAIVGGIGAWRGEDGDSGPGRLLRTIARLVFAAATGAFAFAGQAYGALLMLVIYLLLHPGDRRTLLRRTWPFLAAMALVGAVAVGRGVLRDGVGEGLKAAVAFPYPTGLTIGAHFAGVYALFVLALGGLALRTPREDDGFLRFAALAFLLPVTAVGLVTKWPPLRYMIGGYPFLLIVSAAMLAGLARLVHRRFALPIAVVVVLSGALLGHGVPQVVRAAYLEMGDALDEEVWGFPYYPDHRTPGLYVKEHLRDSDTVVAVDMIEQRWYVGRVDYMLRGLEGTPEDQRRFSFTDAAGVMRGSYSGARALPDDRLPDLKGRIWVITSGELSYRLDQFLSPAQLAWLAEIERTHEPACVGEDGQSKAYLVER